MSTKTWLTADWHLGEDRFALMQRPFENAQQHVDALVSNHNQLVAPEDTVYVVGDVCYQKFPEFLSNVSRFNGRKILLRGNHDKVITDEQFKPYFEEIVPEGEGLELDIAGIPCNLVHYPSLAVAGRFNIVGHIHAAWKFQLNALNVGVDVNHFRPVEAETQVPFFLKAISEFYDNDVWCAYSDANASHRPTRGKKTSYFDTK